MNTTSQQVAPIAIPTEVQQALADEYASLRYSPQAEPAFRQLLNHADAKVHAVQLKGRRIALRDRIVQAVFGQENPYHSFEELREAALVDGLVFFDASTDHYHHPLWTGHDMAKYMVWHDLLGHVETGLDFTPQGELALFAHHGRELYNSGHEAAVSALFVEIVYRVAWINTYGWTWKYKAVVPDPVHAPVATWVIQRVMAGKPVTLPERHHGPRKPWLDYHRMHLS